MVFYFLIKKEIQRKHSVLGKFVWHFSSFYFYFFAVHEKEGTLRKTFGYSDF